MSQIIENAAVPYLTSANLRFLRAADAAAVVVPFGAPCPGANSLLFAIEADDESDEATVVVELGRAAEERLADVALRLASFNSRFRFVTFSMTANGTVRADVCVELTHTTDQVALIGLAFERLHRAVGLVSADLVEAMHGRAAARRDAVVSPALLAQLASMPSAKASA